VVSDELVNEELEVIGYGEACRAFLTANEIEYALSEGLESGFSAAGQEGFDCHIKSVLEFIVKEGVV
jgi:hypothetical protein